MNKSKKIWLFAASILIAIVAVVFIGESAAVNFDLAKLSIRKFQTKTYEFTEDFENIYINVETAVVTFAPSNDEICKIECVEDKKLAHSVGIQDNTLKVSIVDGRKWYDYINISLQTPAITIYLPENVYVSLYTETKTGDIKIPDRYSFQTVSITGTTSNITCCASVSKDIELNTTTGRITLSSSETETVSLSATTGKVAVNDIICNKLSAQSVTGLIYLQNVIAADSIKVENTTGGVRFSSCDAPDISVKTSTGSVKGTFLSEKIFITDTSTGKVNVPDSIHGGKCKITTTTGSIEISID